MSDRAARRPAHGAADANKQAGDLGKTFDAYPPLLTVPEVAELLRTTPSAVYAKIQRCLLPGVIRDGRRVLVHRAEFVAWLEERRAASSGR